MKSVLFVGAHPDDIEIGAGAVLVDMLQSNIRKNVYYLALSECEDIERNKGKILSEIGKVSSYLEDLACARVGFKFEIENFPNRRMAEEHMAIRKCLEMSRDMYKPDLIFCPALSDIHQDHRYISEEVFRVFRNSSILSYEVPRSTDTNNWNPNFYLKVNKESVDHAIELIKIYESQSGLDYMNIEAIKATLRHRGNEIGSEYAQAFQIVRFAVDPNLFF